MQIRFYIGYDLDENVKMQNSSDCKTFVKKRVHQAYVKKKYQGGEKSVNVLPAKKLSEN